MFRIEVYLGKGMGWQMGVNSYTSEQLVDRIERLDKVGIVFRVVPEKYLYI